MRIDYVYIKDFKNLKKFRINFDEKQMNTVLLGQNATGKSNFLEALILIFKYLDLGETPPANLRYKITYRIEHRIIRINHLGEKSVIEEITPIEFDFGDKKKLISFKKQVPKAKFLRNKELYLPRYIFTYYSGLSDRLANSGQSDHPVLI